MSQYRRSFEIVEIPWRVRDKYNIVPHTSIRPPLLVGDFIDPNLRGSKVCMPAANTISANLPAKHDVWGIIQDHINGDLLFALSLPVDVFDLGQSGRFADLVRQEGVPLYG